MIVLYVSSFRSICRKRWICILRKICNCIELTSIRWFTVIYFLFFLSAIIFNVSLMGLYSLPGWWCLFVHTYVCVCIREQTRNHYYRILLHRERKLNSKKRSSRGFDYSCYRTNDDDNVAHAQSLFLLLYVPRCLLYLRYLPLLMQKTAKNEYTFPFSFSFSLSFFRFSLSFPLLFFFFFFFSTFFL